MMSNMPIGYTEEHGAFTPIYNAQPGSIVTHAFILCKNCNGAISSCTGPRYNAVCLICYEKAQDERTN